MKNRILNVVGMGIDGENISAKGLTLIKNADFVMTVGKKSKCFDFVSTLANVKVCTLDGLFRSGASAFFDLAVSRIIARTFTHKTPVLCLDGGGYDSRLYSFLKASSIELNTVRGASFLSKLLSVYPSEDYLALSVDDLQDKLLTDASQNTLVWGVRSKKEAALVQQRLSALFSSDCECILTGSNLVAEKLVIPIKELSSQSSYAFDTAVGVFPMPLLARKVFGYSDFVHILQLLRAPDGCEWDKAQTHESIRKHTIEEAYELASAIDSGNLDNMIEEVGDVIMQGLFHIEIARANGEFDYRDVYSHAVNKLISRHTHIFGKDKADSAQAALSTWDRNKIAEKGITSHTQNLKDVPRSMSALMRASKVQSRAKKANFDWTDISFPFAKIYEELDEVKAELFEQGRASQGDKAQTATASIIEQNEKRVVADTQITQNATAQEIKTVQKNQTKSPDEVELLNSEKAQGDLSGTSFNTDNAQKNQTGNLDEVELLNSEKAIKYFVKYTIKEGISRSALEKEFGDLLFAVVNACRFADVDPELALTRSTESFIERFSKIEAAVTEKGRKCEDCTLAELDALWEEVKRR
ncbi:MAG: MazG family protein [Clostridia bacterium]|nr:MazG family protein [Clostridia bacterium]